MTRRRHALWRLVAHAPPIARSIGVRARIRDDDRARDDAQSMAKMSTTTARASSAPSRASPAPSRRRPCVTINLLTCVSYTMVHELYILQKYTHHASTHPVCVVVYIPLNHLQYETACVRRRQGEPTAAIDCLVRRRRRVRDAFGRF